MHTNQIDEILNNVTVIPVIRLENENETSAVGEALVGGGLSVIEVTLRSDYALSAISQLKRSFPSTLIGAGTVTNTEQYKASIDSGADFIVSPGSPPTLLDSGAKPAMAGSKASPHFSSEAPIYTTPKTFNVSSKFKGIRIRAPV